MTARLETLFGPGLVIRYGEMVMWTGPEASRGLINYLVKSARRLTTDPAAGRILADKLEHILSGGDPEPATRFVTVKMSGCGAAVPDR